MLETLSVNFLLGKLYVKSLNFTSVCDNFIKWRDLKRKMVCGSLSCFYEEGELFSCNAAELELSFPNVTLVLVWGKNKIVISFEKK